MCNSQQALMCIIILAARNSSPLKSGWFRWLKMVLPHGIVKNPELLNSRKESKEHSIN